MSEWKELKTLQEVAQAIADGLEIYSLDGIAWELWDGETWRASACYRARPKQPKMKVVLREAVIEMFDGTCWTSEINQARYDIYNKTGSGFKATWIGPERIVEVPEND